VDGGGYPRDVSQSLTTAKLESDKHTRRRVLAEESSGETHLGRDVGRGVRRAVPVAGHVKL